MVSSIGRTKMHTLRRASDVHLWAKQKQSIERAPLCDENKRCAPLCRETNDMHICAERTNDAQTKLSACTVVQRGEGFAL